MDTAASNAPSGNSAGRPNTLLYPALLFVFTLASRILCRGPLYFGDGPTMAGTIADKTYIIQPPGYWLFERIAGMFRNPVLAMSAMNILFSVAGVVVFYYTACFFTARINALLAAFAYSATFYIWFSGEIHSTYASQILFPVAVFFMLMHYDRSGEPWMLGTAALLFAIGAGLRPTDGFFLVPLALYFAIFRMPRTHGMLFLALIGILCLGWIIPTWLAFEHSQSVLGFMGYVGFITRQQSILTGVSKHTLANVVRYALPLLTAFWPVLWIALRKILRERSDWRTTAFVIWIFPGSLFFIVVLIANAPYLDFLTAAILLLAVSAPRLMLTTALWNVVVFLAFGPVPSQSLAVNIANSFVLRYTRGGIVQRYNLTLSEMEHHGDAQ